MPSSLSDMGFQFFQSYIKEKCGIEISRDKAYLIETRLSGLLAESGLESFDALYQSIMKKDDPGIREKIIDAITTNETLWFRDKTPWLVLEQFLLPQYIEALRTGSKKKIRIWSAAASTGQEAYSTAMCIDRYLRHHDIHDVGLSQFEIIGTDISKAVLSIAKKGRYDAISIMRGMDPSYKMEYFKKEGMAWVIDERIRRAVCFEHFNLQNSFLFLGRFEVVFCRYVLIYFADILRDEVIRKLYGGMEHQGVLFIGASEFFNGMNRYFEMRSEGGTFYVKRSERDAATHG